MSSFMIMYSLIRDTGDIEVFNNCDGVSQLSMCNTGITGNIKVFSNCSYLTDVDISFTKATGAATNNNQPVR